MQARDRFFASLRLLRDEAMRSAAPPQDAVGVIDVGERLDARSAERMKTRFRQLAQEGRSHHVIDLSRLDDLDSGGLASLISTLRAVRESGGSVHLVAGSDRVTHILEVTAMSRLFKVHPSLQDALAAV